MDELTRNEKRDLLRVLTIQRAQMEAEDPMLMLRTEGAHLELCERINALKAELDAPAQRQEAA